MAIIDFVSWTPQGGKTIYAHKFPETNLSTYTQLVVQESQEAVLFSKGEIIGKFGPGKHTLNTENLPILRKLYGLPFGGKNPFTAEIWFVNKVQPTNLDWQTDSMSIHDVDYNTQIPLIARGRYGIKIVDAEKFLVKIVGTKNEYTQDDITDNFYGEFVSKAKSMILKVMINNRIGFKSISACLDTIGDELRKNMDPFWMNIGFELIQFYVTAIDIDQSTENGRNIARSIAQQSEQQITGHTWQQEKMFDVLGNAVDGMQSGGGGMLGGLMAMGMMGGFGGGGMGTNVMNPQYNQPVFNAGGQNIPAGGMQQPHTQIREVYCSNCSKKYTTDHNFCPYCGDPYNPCPKCGTDNPKDARRCVCCGTPLTGSAGGGTCPNCNAPLQPGATFCGNCGKQVNAGGDTCTRCGCTLKPTDKFCPKCGNKR